MNAMNPKIGHFPECPCPSDFVQEHKPCTLGTVAVEVVIVGKASS